MNSENVPDRPGQKVACLIVKGFLLKMGLRFYLDGPKQIAGVDQTTPKSASNVINEHHQLFESYFHDSLLKDLLARPPFERERTPLAFL